jgi:hypothetical protein
VTLEIRCIDRLLLTFRQPRLQYGQGIHGFFCHHRGNQFVSSALMLPMTERFAADIRHYIDSRGLDLVRFAKGQSKDQIARRYLACHDGGEQILFAGVAQEKTRIWRTRQWRDPVTGKRYPWLCQEQAMVNHWYFYGFDAGFGPYAGSPAAPDTRPRPAHQPRTTRPRPAPASRPRLPGRPDRPRPAGIPRRLTPPAAITRSNHEPVISRHTRRNLTRNSKSLRGKITYS